MRRGREGGSEGEGREREGSGKERERREGWRKEVLTLEDCPSPVPGVAKTGVETVLLEPVSALFGDDVTSLAGPTLSIFGLFEAGTGSKTPLAWTEDTAWAGGMELGPTVSTLPAGVLPLK